MIRELNSEESYILLVNVVDSVDDNKYAVITVVLDYMTFMISHSIELQSGVPDSDDLHGFYQTNVMKASDGPNGELVLEDVITVRRNEHVRQAIKFHDDICAELENETFDFVSDPYYQQVQISNMQHELANFDTSDLKDL